MIELAATIWTSYESLGLEEDLAWRLRGQSGPTRHHAVIDFIRTNGPEKTVKDLILSSKAVATAVGEKMNFQFFAEEGEDETVRRLLWKIGFAIPRYDDTYQVLRNRIQEFHNYVLHISPELNESDKAKVRGIGVNLFVSVEAFLEDLICYNVWLLSSDHFTGTRFRFTKADSHEAIIKTLGGSIQSGDSTFSWSETGANTLGTLLVYLQAYRGWLKDRVNADRNSLMRAKEDYPHYAKSTVLVFPFKHTALWADIAPEPLATYTELLDNIYTQLTQADLPLIRNGIDHKREEEEFPSPDKMLACISRLQQVVDMADTNRLIPKLFWGLRSESDRNDNKCNTFTDYRGATVPLWDPPLMVSSPSKDFGKPYIIAPLDFLYQPNTVMIFNIIAKSEYSDYWKNYPRRRFIPPKQDIGLQSVEDKVAE